jgi:hypothetical protein
MMSKQFLTDYGILYLTNNFFIFGLKEKMTILQHSLEN